MKRSSWTKAGLLGEGGNELKTLESGPGRERRAHTEKQVGLM